MVLFEVLEVQRRMMIFSGAWPRSKPTLLYTLRGIIFPLFPFVLAITFVLRIYQDFGDLVKVTQILFFGITDAIYLSKHAIFVYYRPKFFQIMRDLEKPEFKVYEDRKSVKNHISIFLKIARAYQISVAFAASSISFAPLVDKQETSWKLPFAFPFTIANNFAFSLVFAFQILGVLITGWNCTCLDTIPCGFIAVACGQVKVLRENLENATQVHAKSEANDFELVEDTHGKLDEIVNEKLKKCVKHHAFIIDYVQLIETIFTKGYLVQVLGSVVAISLTGLNFLVQSPASVQFVVMCGYFVGIMGQLGLGFAYGNELIVESSKIPQSCYLSQWNTCGSRVRKSLFIIMERAKTPLALTVGNFSALSLDTFARIIKSTYTYFAVLRQVYTRSTTEQQH